MDSVISVDTDFLLLITTASLGVVAYLFKIERLLARLVSQVEAANDRHSMIVDSLNALADKIEEIESKVDSGAFRIRQLERDCKNCGDCKP